MNTLNDIFGTFRPLTPAQMKGNAQFVALWSASLLIVLVGVVAAVRTGIVWIGVVAGGIWMGVIFLLANNRKVKYVPKFGVKYNLLRFFDRRLPGLQRCCLARLAWMLLPSCCKRRMGNVFIGVWLDTHDNISCHYADFKVESLSYG